MPAEDAGRVAALEEENIRLRRSLLMRQAECGAIQLVMAHQLIAAYQDRLAQVSEQGCAYGSICIDISDLLLLLAAIPPLPGGFEHGPDR